MTAPVLVAAVFAALLSYGSTALRQGIFSVMCPAVHLALCKAVRPWGMENSRASTFACGAWCGFCDIV